LDAELIKSVYTSKPLLADVKHRQLGVVQPIPTPKDLSQPVGLIASHVEKKGVIDNKKVKP